MNLIFKYKTAQKRHDLGLKPTCTLQKIRQSDDFEKLLNSVRERIEGVFHEIQNTGKHLEHLLAKTRVGLMTRVITKVTSHLLKHLLRLQFGIDIQTFSAHSAF